MPDPLNELRRLGFDPDAAGIRRTQELVNEMEEGATAEQALDNLPMYGGACEADDQDERHLTRGQVEYEDDLADDAATWEGSD